MSSRARISVGALTVLVWLVSLGGPAAARQDPPRGDVPRLVARAQASGPLRVIVRLQVPVQPESVLPAPQVVAAQRASIATAQQRVIGRMRAASRANVKRFSTVPFLAFEATAADLSILSSDPDVATIVEDVVYRPTLAQSTALIGATTMSALNYRGDGWTVAILDTGVDSTHPFLAGRVVSEACYSTTYGSFQSVCPGGAGESTAPGAARNCTGFSGCEHGTHVAGIAAGSGATFNGVAPDSSILAIQVFSGSNSFSDCGASSCVGAFTSDLMMALERVYALRTTLNIASVNMSLGGVSYTSNCDDDPLKPFIDQLRAAGTATVIASGNSGFSNAISEPGCISTAISVGSTTDGSSGVPADQVSSFSNSASFLNLLAPGQVITSSVPGGGFANFNGTSMATPHVAGAWAVLKGRNPSATVDEILSALTSSGAPITDARNGVTKPRIDVNAARMFVPATCTIAVSPSGATGPYSGFSGTLTVTAPAGCAWRVVDEAPSFLTLTSGAAGVGSGTVSYTVAPKSTIGMRSGTLRVRQGELEATTVVSQNGAPTIAGDVNGDGRPDLVWQNAATNNIALWVMEGSVAVDTPAFTPNVADPAHQIVATADIDGDGHTDLIWQDFAAGVIEVWLMNGSVRMSVQTIGPTIADTNWRVAGSGDFNGDGRTDLVLRHETSGALGVWFLDGTTRIGAGLMSPSSVDPAWKLRGIGDFNRDEKPDFIWQHTTGSLAVWFMDGIRVQDTRYLTISSVGDPAWKIVGVADVNRDLRSDLIWQHQTSGHIAVWYLWDNAVLDTRFLTPNQVADTNWKIVGPK